MGKCQSSCNFLVNKESTEGELQHNKSHSESYGQQTSSHQYNSSYQQQSQDCTKPFQDKQVQPFSSGAVSLKDRSNSTPLQSTYLTQNVSLSQHAMHSSNSQQSSQILLRQAVQHESTYSKMSQEYGLRKIESKKEQSQKIYSPILDNYAQELKPKTKFRACISIFYGTMGGTASEKAFELAERCEIEGFYVKLVRLLHFEPWMLRACQVAVFILASQGYQRGPTDDAQQFYLWLNNFDNTYSPLENLKFSVFGLYNSMASKRMSQANANFNDTTEMDSTNGLDSLNNPSSVECQNNCTGENNPNTSRFNNAIIKKPSKIKSMGQRIDMVLEEVGAQRFYQLKQIDSFKLDLLKDAFRLYVNDFVSILLKQYPLVEILEEEAYSAALPFNISLESFHDMEIGVHLEQIESIRKDQDVYYSTKRQASKDQYPLREEMWEYFQGSNTTVLKTQFYETQNDVSKLKQSLQQTQYIMIELDSIKGESFETGGIVEVFVQNDNLSIEELLKILNLDLKTQLRISAQSERVNGEFRPPFPSLLPLEQYLKDFMDMQGKVDQSQVYELAKFCERQEDQQELRKLCKYSQKEKFEKGIGKNHSLFSLIVKYSIKIPLLLLCGVSKILKPRSYIIASSNLESHKTISFIVKLQTSSQENNYKCVANEYFKEIFSLSQQESKQQMRVKFSQNPQWKLPLAKVENHQKFIMICFEEGISFCLASLKHFKKKQSCEEVHLYYCCRLLNDKTYLLQNELLEFYKEGILQSLNIILVDSDGQVKHHHYSSTNNRDIDLQNIINLKSGPMQQPLRTPQRDASAILNKDAASFKSNWSPLQQLIENSIGKFSTLIHNIKEKDANIKIFICGSQLLSQGVLSALAKVYSSITKQSEYEAFNDVLDLETEGKIVRITWTQPIINYSIKNE